MSTFNVISYNAEKFTWNFGNMTKGPAQYYTLPEKEADGRPRAPFGTVEEGRGIQPPITDWKSREGYYYLCL